MVKEDKILYLPWKDLKRLRDRRLHYFITRHLYPFSPYYRRLFDKHKINPWSIKTVEDLRRIPFTSKDNFVGPPHRNPAKRNIEFVLQPTPESIKRFLPKCQFMKFLLAGIIMGKDFVKNRLEKEYRPIFLTATAGTTREPISFLYTSYDLDNLRIYGRRIVELLGVKPGLRTINLFPYAPHLAFWQTVFAGFGANQFILSTGGGKVLGTEGNINSILKVKPQFLIGVPSYIYHILKTAYDRNLKIRFISTIVLGAARVPKGFKLKISKLLAEMGSKNVKVIGTYGFTEARCAWTECPTDIDISSGYHTYPDKEVFEVIDPNTGEVKKEGEDGEIVYSNIDARGSCVLRYRTGDLVEGGIVYSPCPYCGRTVPRLSSDISRATNVKNLRLSKIKGALVNLNALEHLLDDNQLIDQWQIEIKKKNNDPFEVDELVLYVSLNKEMNKEAFCSKINQEAFSNADVSFNKIEFVTRQEIRQRLQIESSVKAKKIIDRRDECSK